MRMLQQQQIVAIAVLDDLALKLLLHLECVGIANAAKPAYL